MLTDAHIKRTKPAEKPFKLADGGGLFVLVSPSGSKLWRLKYRYHGKEKLLSIGPYPAIGLIEARQAREEAKAMLRAGNDPSVVKKLSKLSGAASDDVPGSGVASAIAVPSGQGRERISLPQQAG
jgi:hypothetical protein